MRNEPEMLFVSLLLAVLAICGRQLASCPLFWNVFRNEIFCSSSMPLKAFSATNPAGVCVFSSRAFGPRSFVRAVYFVF